MSTDSTIEAVVLTGGQSRRMGRDKAKLEIDGVAQAERIVRQFLENGIPVTVLGREPVLSAKFVRDREDFGGPITALASFQPTADYIFVASCDLPRFDVRLSKFLLSQIAEHDACVPEVDGFRQPLCALYRNDAFAKLKNLEDQCAMGWLNALDVRIVTEQEMHGASLLAAVARGANTPEELAKAVSEVQA